MAKKRIFPIFIITLTIGIGLIAYGFYDADFSITGLTSFSFITVPIDPTTGQILGTVKFGAPDVVPFERSGTILSAEIGQRCDKPRSGEVISPTNNWVIPFGRIGSGDRNAEVSWHGYNGIDCGYGYAEWDLTDLPNDFVATGIRLQLNLKSVQGAGTESNNSISCTIVSLGENVDTIGVQTLPNRITWGSDIGGTQSQQMASTLVPVDSSTGDFVAWGGAYIPSAIGLGSGGTSPNSWCKTVGVKTFVFGQMKNSGFNSTKGVETFNKALPLDSKFTLGFTGGGGAGKFVIDQQWWKDNGALLVTGYSNPIKCNIGFKQVDFRCVPIICPKGEKVDPTTNQCAPIQCPVGQVLQFIQEQVSCIALAGVSCPQPILAVCTPIQCKAGEELVGSTCQQIVCPSGTHLIGSTCDPLACGEGFEVSGNECALKTCTVGEELVGDNCQKIVCPINTSLQGNDCVELSCPSLQIAIDNKCQTPPEEVPVQDPVNGDTTEPYELPTCGMNEKLVGDTCFPIDLNCPAGTESHENVCVQRLPSLLQISGINPSLFLITGLIIAGMSGIGIIVRRRA